ncbi:glycosyltransferase family 2 protein [Iodidimonas sp. SYSU 1G8]|uniref:glycosyltransferase family 2 protein n=1 Tax=Iodidimonas sp. SYSU 1G8 TaxID=3133967 RepID=UPI0031FECC18
MRRTDRPAPEISVVIPTRNEVENARAIATAVIAELEKLQVSFELIFIDNASTDGTVAVIKAMCQDDPRINLIANQNDFGQMRSPTYGIYQARGAAVINLCADFQDPPALIPEFIRSWRDGAMIVLGVRKTERNGFMLGVFRHLAYSFSNRFFDHPVIPHATGFGLYDRKVVDTLSAIDEPEPFFRGLLVEFGYPLTLIPYDRPGRAGGKSNNNFFTLLDFSMSALAGMGKRLLRLPVYLGILSGLLGLVLLLIGAVVLISDHSAWPLFLWAIIEINVGVVLIFLGLLGDQIRLISERTRRTPLVVEKERINLGQTQ